MAFSGLHVACRYAGGPGWGRDPMPVAGAPVWSENMASAATTTNTVPGATTDDSYGGVLGQPIFSVRASADAWIAIGATPNASTGARLFVAANTDYDVFVKPGDKLAWIAA